MNPNQHRNALNKHDKLHWYEIQEILGQGGFGITYLARDTNLDQLVAIKEYLPTEFSTRDKANTVQPISENHTEIFDWGKQRFLDEAKTLAQFRHPNVVRVNSFFENNNTGYMVMEYEEGTELGALIKAGESFDETRMMELLLPVIDGLEQIHAQGFIHRDIKPANIFIRNDGSPVLIDFGSARQAIGEQTRTLTSLVTPGFAPFEQYHDAEGKQGPWTDIYSMGATCYSMITSKPPIDALKRGMARLDHSTDAYLSLEDLKAGSYSEHFLRAIDKALEFKEVDRPQNVESWRAMLVGEEVLPAVTAVSAPASTVTPDQVTEVAIAPTRPDTDVQATQVMSDDDRTAPPKKGNTGLVLAIVAVIAVTIAGMLILSSDPVDPPLESERDASSQTQTGPTEAELQEQARIAAEKAKLQQEQDRLATEKELLKQEQARLAEENKQRQAELAEQQAAEEKKRQADLAKQKAAEEKKRKADLAKKKAAEEKKRKADLAKQKAEAEKKRKAEEAKQKLAGGKSSLSGNWVPDEGFEEVVLTQSGNRIKGKIGTNGSTLEGLINGNRIEFIFSYSRTGYGFREGTGEFIISADGNRLVGSRFKGGFPQRSAWNLTRGGIASTAQSTAQTASIPEPEVKTATSSAAANNLAGTYVPDEGFEDLKLQQRGNKITGTIGTNGSTIRGTLEGNQITFVFNYSRTGYGFRDGYGKFTVSADGKRLVGTRSKAGFPVNSSWNLTRKTDN